MSSWIARAAASLSSGGHAKSGNPWARLTAPASTARRFISRMTDSVKLSALAEIRERLMAESLRARAPVGEAGGVGHVRAAIRRIVGRWRIPGRSPAARRTRLTLGIVGCLTLLSVGWTGLLIPSLIRSIEATFDQTDAGIGVIYLVYAVAYMSGSFGGGTLTERFGRRLVLGGAVLLHAAGIAGSASPRAGRRSSSRRSWRAWGRARSTAGPTASCSTCTARAAAAP